MMFDPQHRELLWQFMGFGLWTYRRGLALGRVNPGSGGPKWTLSVSRAALDEFAVWWVKQSPRARAALAGAPPPPRGTEALLRIPGEIPMPTAEDKRIQTEIARSLMAGEDPDDLIERCAQVSVPTSLTEALRQWNLGAAFEEAERILGKVEKDS